MPIVVGHAPDIPLMGRASYAYGQYQRRERRRARQHQERLLRMRLEAREESQERSLAAQRERDVYLEQKQLRDEERQADLQREMAEFDQDLKIRFEEGKFQTEKEKLDLALENQKEMFDYDFDASQKRQIEQWDAQARRLKDLALDGTITPEEYAEFNQQLQLRRAGIKPRKRKEYAEGKGIGQEWVRPLVRKDPKTGEVLEHLGFIIETRDHNGNIKRIHEVNFAELEEKKRERLQDAVDRMIETRDKMAKRRSDALKQATQEAGSMEDAETIAAHMERARRQIDLELERDFGAILRQQEAEVRSLGGQGWFTPPTPAPSPTAGAGAMPLGTPSPMGAYGEFFESLPQITQPGMTPERSAMQQMEERYQAGMLTAQQRQMYEALRKRRGL